MDRSAWLKEKRRLAEERMDTLFAPIYDDNWGATIDPSHRQMIDRFLERCPPGCTILDAACGTGKYWPIILASGRTIYGIDQSQQMLNRAHAKHPDVRIEKLGLQELDFVTGFDGIICMDAMELVYPEDWPLVLANFHLALKPAGQLYLTVELADLDEVRASFEAARRLGRPVVAGEWAHEDGYHYYPELAQVREWLDAAQFDILEEMTGDGYQHVLAQRRAE